MKRSEIIRWFEVKPDSKFRLAARATHHRHIERFAGFPEDKLKERAADFLEENQKHLAYAQELLYANDVYSLLIIFQAMDAGGKDGTIKHVMSGVNPQGCQVASFKRPSDEELDHDFLWRYNRHLPERGRIGIFNRSYYEEVLVVRVHPELLERQKLPPGKRGKKFWSDRHQQIKDYEEHLAKSGTLVLKFFLNISKAEQKKRFLDRLTKPEKFWKFNSADLSERAYWDEYMGAYEDAIAATSTPWAPWFVIPADQKWFARAAVSGIISQRVEQLGLKTPSISKARLQELEKARQLLLSE